ncbi:hypothetical protein ACFLQ0_00700 [Nitrospinota bacterium]
MIWNQRLVSSSCTAARRLISSRGAYIAGKVVDCATGRPVYGVEMRTIPASNIARTDVLGHHTIHVPNAASAPATYTVRGTKDGYYATSGRVGVQTGHNFFVDMYIRRR